MTNGVPGGPAPYQAPYAPPGAPVPQMVSHEAKEAEKFALVWGLVALAGGVLTGILLFTGPVAIHYGNKAKHLGGDGTVGLVLGWVATGLIIVFMLLFILWLVIFLAFFRALG